MAYDEDKCDMEWNEVRQPAIYARAVLAALRDPPPHVIEAGARALARVHFDRKQWYGDGPKEAWVAGMADINWRNHERIFSPHGARHSTRRSRPQTQNAPPGRTESGAQMGADEVRRPGRQPDLCDANSRSIFVTDAKPSSILWPCSSRRRPCDATSLSSDRSAINSFSRSRSRVSNSATLVSTL